MFKSFPSTRNEFLMWENQLGFAFPLGLVNAGWQHLTVRWDDDEWHSTYVVRLSLNIIQNSICSLSIGQISTLQGRGSPLFTTVGQTGVGGNDVLNMLIPYPFNPNSTGSLVVWCNIRPYMQYAVKFKKTFHFARLIQNGNQFILPVIKAA